MEYIQTQLLDSSDKSISICSQLLKDGEIVGMPTETVYGLAGNALNPEAIKKIFIAKGRPQDNPLIVHISEIEELKELAHNIPDIAYTLAKAFWPGPMTMILPKNDIIPYETSGGLDTVGIRMPSHPVARKLIKKSGVPIAAPSGNLSGSPSPTLAQHMLDDMNGRIPAIIDGGSCDVGVESTVISFEKDGVRILRPGYISADDMSLYTKVYIDDGVVHKIGDNTVVRSPGMKYKHYAPKAHVVIIDSSFDKYLEFMDKNYRENTWCVVFDHEKEHVKYPYFTYGDTSKEQARQLFDILRELDKHGAEDVYFRCPQKNGVGLAVYNRLLRAAGFEVIEL